MFMISQNDLEVDNTRQECKACRHNNLTNIPSAKFRTGKASIGGESYPKKHVVVKIYL